MHLPLHLPLPSRFPGGHLEGFAEFSRTFPVFLEGFGPSPVNTVGTHHIPERLLNSKLEKGGTMLLGPSRVLLSRHNPQAMTPSSGGYSREDNKGSPSPVAPGVPSIGYSNHPFNSMAKVKATATPLPRTGAAWECQGFRLRI